MSRWRARGRRDAATPASVPGVDALPHDALSRAYSAPVRRAARFVRARTTSRDYSSVTLVAISSYGQGIRARCLCQAAVRAAARGRDAAEEEAVDAVRRGAGPEGPVSS